jgi:hypothetical protein
MQIFQFKNRNYNRTVNCLQTFEEAGVTDWAPLSGKIAVQVTGSASAVSFIVERSVSDPAGPMGANPAPVEETETKGDPTSGMSPSGYFEPSTAWWRVRVINVADGSVLVALSGALGGDLV